MQLWTVVLGVFLQAALLLMVLLPMQATRTW
jgi:hypothetical protein